MAETGTPGDSAANPAGSQAASSTELPAGLAALRASGAADRDPVRFAYLVALTRRAAPQPAAIRSWLDARISAAVAELAARPASPASEPTVADTASPLAELLAYIGQQAHDQVQPVALPGVPATAASGQRRPVEAKNSAVGRSAPAPELKSVAYFRDEWSKLSTEQQLTQTLAQAPENAGPMNSQHLVLRSLQRMRDIAPDYLQGFMSYIDTLIWLEHADPTRPAGGRATDGESKARPGKRTSAKR
ncbi:MAG: DUF2894 domain-containing protein [Rhodocyclales bacterium GT-UBC]|nr:MAG: DUF2894 domain-containing protein [Rhodocyclales bacterium GT-UBC]